MVEYGLLVALIALVALSVRCGTSLLAGGISRVNYTHSMSL